jgi:hypothetical protein
MDVFSEFLDVSDSLRRRQYAEGQRRFYANYLKPAPNPTREEYLAMTPRQRDSHQKFALANGWCEWADVEPRTHDEQYVEDAEDWTKPDLNAGGV